MQLGKRSKGFPLRVSPQNIISIHAVYPWLKANGFTDEYTDAALAALPPPPPVVKGDSNFPLQFATEKLSKPMTVRIRAEHIHSLGKLFSMVCELTGGAVSLSTCARKLQGVDVFDLLVDAGR